MRRRRHREQSLLGIVVSAVFTILFVRYFIPWQISQILATLNHVAQPPSPTQVEPGQ